MNSAAQHQNKGVAGVAAIDPAEWLKAHGQPSGAGSKPSAIELGAEAIRRCRGSVTRAMKDSPDLSIEIALAYLMNDKNIGHSTAQRIAKLAKALDVD